MEHKRLIEIEGCYNLRDVGGYATKSGGVTRFRQLLRSASPHRMPPESWQPLQELGVQTLIDLRRPREAANESYETALLAGMQYKPIPLFDDQNFALVDQTANTLSELYANCLAHCGPQFASILRTIAAEEAAALVHCAVGKDRTGMVIALALGAAGVDNETIAENYSLSNALLSPLFPSFRAEVAAEGGDSERLERMLESRREVMLDMLALLDETYGGFSGYFERIGLEAETVKQLRKKLVQPA